MSLLFRLIRVVLAALRGAPLGALDESAVRFRVWPNDLDLNGHMNNGRYLTVMDLGRVDLMLRLGIGRLAFRRGWRPVIGTAVIRYRRSLDPFDRYLLRSRVICWDAKWFYIEQRFDRDGTTLAVALVKGLLLGRTGPVPTAEVLAAVGVTLPSPAMPEAVRRLDEAEARLS